MNFDQAFSQLAETLQRSIVQIQNRRHGSGSGVIWNADGLIITNSHVVRGQSAAIALSDGRMFQATVMARNPARDLAALQIDASNLPAIDIGTCSRVGELVFAVGNPRGSLGAVTTGILHKLGSTWIHADVKLAPGNSGGALTNAQGQVIGINTMILNGCGLAIPSQAVEKFLQSSSDRPYLGITLQPVGVMLDRRPAHGLLITELESGSPAQLEGFLPGDVIIGVRGTLFQFPEELFQIMLNSNVGDEIAIDFLRGGQRHTKTIILDSQTAQAA